MAKRAGGPSARRAGLGARARPATRGPRRATLIAVARLVRGRTAAIGAPCGATGPAARGATGPRSRASGAPTALAACGPTRGITSPFGSARVSTPLIGLGRTKGPRAEVSAAAPITRRGEGATRRASSISGSSATAMRITSTGITAAALMTTTIAVKNQGAPLTLSTAAT